MGGDNGMSDMNGGMGMPDMGGGCSAAEKACNDNSNCTRLRSLAFPNHVGEHSNGGDGSKQSQEDGGTPPNTTPGEEGGEQSGTPKAEEGGEQSDANSGVGEDCTDDKDCASGTCGSDSKCEAVADDNASGSTRVGEDCTDDKDCASGTCGRSDSTCEAADGGRRRESGEEGGEENVA